MKTYTQKRKLNILLTLTACLLCFGFAIGFALPKNNAKATSLSQTGVLLPKNDIEQKNLIAPIDAYSDGLVTAVIESFDQSLYIYTADNGYNATAINGTSFKQVKKLADNLLLVSDNGHINIVDTTTYARTRFDYDTPENSFGGNFFDLNENYLVTNYSAKADVYTIENNQIVEKTYSFEIASETPIAINGNDEIFYVFGSGSSYSIRKQPVGRVADVVSFNQTLSVKPSQIIANNDYVYLIIGHDVCRFNNDGTNFTTLTVNGDDNFELGNLVAPTSISFKGDNLIIADSTIGAVQEFSIDGDTLNFTGFAIAKGKTAYNRISADALDVESLNGKVAVLDQNKLTIVLNGEDFDAYDNANFKNYFASNFNGLMPLSFALGYNGVGVINNDNTFSILTFKKDLLTKVNGIDGTVTLKDVCYRTGNYYVLATDGADTFVYVVSEDGASLCDTKVYHGVVGEILTVDVKGNIYFADATNVYKNDTTSIAVRGSIIKLNTDLACRLYGSDAQKIYLYDTTNGTFNDTGFDGNAKTFTMNFDTKTVYYLCADDESIYSSTNLGNLGIDSLSVPTDYVTYSTQTDESVIKPYTKQSGTNAFAVEVKDTAFSYLNTSVDASDYLLICQIETGIDGFNLGAFATPTGTVIVDMADVTALSPTFEGAPEKAYITTDSNAYYYPIISQHSLYSLVVSDTDTTKIRLPKGTVVNPISKTTYLDREFYLATFTYEDVTKTAFIPVAFTVEIPYVQSGYETYTLEQVEETIIYADATLETQLFTISKDTIVRVYSIKDGVAMIGLTNSDGNFVTGYINAQYIQNAPNVAVRNIILVLLVIASISGTSAYFILRKKNKNK